MRKSHLQAHGLPGQKRTFIAKSAAQVASGKVTATFSVLATGAAFTVDQPGAAFTVNAPNAEFEAE